MLLKGMEEVKKPARIRRKAAPCDLHCPRSSERAGASQHIRDKHTSLMQAKAWKQLRVRGWHGLRLSWKTGACLAATECWAWARVPSAALNGCDACNPSTGDRHRMVRSSWSSQWYRSSEISLEYMRSRLRKQLKISRRKPFQDN